MKLSFFKNSVEMVKYPSMLFDHFNDEVRGLPTLSNIFQMFPTRWSLVRGGSRHQYDGDYFVFIKIFMSLFYAPSW